MNKNVETGSIWAYFGRKFWITLIGIMVLMILLMIVHSMDIKPELYDIFAKNITRVIIGFGATNGAISIGSFFKNGKQGG